MELPLQAIGVMVQVTMEMEFGEQTVPVELTRVLIVVMRDTPLTAIALH